MNQPTRKLISSLLIASFIAVNAILLLGLGSIMAFLNTGADRNTMLHSEIKSENIYLPEIFWTDTVNQGRPMEEPTLMEIQEDYLNAWYLRNVAYQTNNPYGIEDYYTDSSRINIYQSIEYNKNSGISIESSTLSHRPKLEFYSDDGQLVVFTDEHVVGYQRIFKNQELILTKRDTSAYQVLMLLEDGFWRIRHLHKVEPNQIEEIDHNNPIAKVENSKVIVDGKPYKIKGINYYPQVNPWDTFGSDFSFDIIFKDFKLIQGSGLNTIRIFIQYEDFGKAKVQQDKLHKLETLLNLANESGLKVIITLFDFYGNYSLLDWTLTHRHAEQIVKHFRHHPAIIAWDIKNEPDLDFERRGKQNVLDWLSEMLDVVKKYDPFHLTTIGWSSAESALLLNEKTEIVSFHYYQDVSGFQSTLTELKRQLGSKPILLEEFGLSSYKGLWNPFGYSEKQQAEYHKKMQELLSKNNLAFMSWTLYDYTRIPNSVAGRLPWRKNKQKEFGFLDRLGNPKPSLNFISN